MTTKMPCSAAIDDEGNAVAGITPGTESGASLFDGAWPSQFSAIDFTDLFAQNPTMEEWSAMPTALDAEMGLAPRLQ